MGPAATIMMGIVLVAFLAARTTVVPPATTMISTLGAPPRLQPQGQEADRDSPSVCYRYSLAQCSIIAIVATLAQSQPNPLETGLLNRFIGPTMNTLSGRLSSPAARRRVGQLSEVKLPVATEEYSISSSLPQYCLLLTPIVKALDPHASSFFRIPPRRRFSQ